MSAPNPLSGTSSVPITDPTALATAMTLREVSLLKELIFVRLDGMDEAIKVAKSDLVRFPSDVDKQVGNLKELHAEKFSSVQSQFLERDARVEQSAGDTKIAVDAALLAAEKAVGKAEVSTTKQIDALGVTLQTATAGLEKQIADLKDRQTRIESLTLGRQEQVTDLRAWAAFGITLILFLITLAGFFLSFGLR